MAVPLDIHMGLEGIFTYMWKSEKKTIKTRILMKSGKRNNHKIRSLIQYAGNYILLPVTACLNT